MLDLQLCMHLENQENAWKFSQMIRFIQRDEVTHLLFPKYD